MRDEYSSSGFSGKTALAFGLNEGNSQYLAINWDGRIDLLYGGNHLFVVANYQYKQGNDEKIVNQGFSHLRYVLSLKNGFYWEAFLQKEFNDFILLKDRNLIGTGVRYHLVDYKGTADTSDKFDIFLGIGAMYDIETYLTTPVQKTTRIFRSTDYLTISWNLNKYLKFNSVTYYQPNIVKLSDYRILIDSGISVLISKNFSFETDLVYRFDNKPVNGIKKYDVQLTNGIGYSF